MVQLAIVGQLPLLHGTADIMLLAVVAWGLHERTKNSWVWALVAGVYVSFISAVPFMVPLVIYLLVNGMARLFQHRFWQTPILAMFFITFVGTLVQHFLTISVLRLSGTIIPIGSAISVVTLPSALLNLVLALPVYALITDLANAVYPVEIEI